MEWRGGKIKFEFLVLKIEIQFSHHWTRDFSNMLNNYNLIILHLSLTVPRSLSRCKKVRKLRNYQNKKVVWLDPIYWDTYVTKSLLRSQFAVKKPLYHKVQKAHCKYFMDCVKYEYESLFLNK